MYSILISLYGAVLLCGKLAQAVDNYGIIDASEPYVASIPALEEFNTVPTPMALSAEMPDTTMYYPEDLEASSSEPPPESIQSISPQENNELKTLPDLGINMAAETGSSDLIFDNSSSVYAPSVLVSSTTTVYQAIPSVSTPTTTRVENPSSAATTTTIDGENPGNSGINGGQQSSTLGNIPSTQVTETSSTPSNTDSITYNATTTIEQPLSTTLTSVSQDETTTLLPSSSYVSMSTPASSVYVTAPSSEITTSLFNSTPETTLPSTSNTLPSSVYVTAPSSEITTSLFNSTPETTLPSTSNTLPSSEVTSETAIFVPTSLPESSVSANTTSNLYPEATSTTLMPSDSGNASSSDVTSLLPSSTLTTSLEYDRPTNTTSATYPEPTSNETLSSIYEPSATITTSSASYNSSIPSVTLSNTLDPSPIETSSSIFGNSSTTAFPDSSSNIPFTPISSTVYSSSTFMPISGNSTTTLSPGSSPIPIPYQSTTQLSNTTYTVYPSNSSTISSPSPSETLVTSSPTKVFPTATNTGSTFIPSSIIAQTSSSYSTGYTTTVSTGIPSSLPKIVQNPMSSSSPVQPEDTAEVQIGFQWALNYPFVVGHPLSTSQIFTYLPIGIADGLGLNCEQIVVKNLFPLDTTEELQYITTVARIFIPASMVDTLRIDLGIAASPIYQNEDDSVRTLMNFINPAIPYFPGTVMQYGALASASASRSTTTPSPNSGVFNTETQQPQSASAKGTTAGIALAACGGAAAYGAAMFLLARRYKHRQQLQQPNRPRSLESTNSSIESAESSTEYGNDGALMSGGRISHSHNRHSEGSGRTGYSARTAQISGPMMSENSLGWN